MSLYVILSLKNVLILENLFSVLKKPVFLERSLENLSFEFHFSVGDDAVLVKMSSELFIFLTKYVGAFLFFVVGVEGALESVVVYVVIYAHF
jgi:hypothetical protein